MPTPLISERIERFLTWLEYNTEYADWDEEIRTKVMQALTRYMIDNPLPEMDWEDE